jgi:hypothetical protein
MNTKNEKNIEFEELKLLMTFYPTLEETASWFDCSPDTVERRIKECWGKTFKEFRELNSGKTRLLLKRKAISKALEEDNERMLIYCLRAMTNLNDKISENGVSGEPVEIKVTYEEALSL